MAEDEEELLRSVALQNARAILLARQRAERELLEAKEALARKSEELARQRELFQVTLSSIADAVVATDTQGKITFLNSVAETLTGMSSSEAAGQPLEKVFTILNRDTREPVTFPVHLVLQQGGSIDVASETTLLARDGTEIYTENSAAPIKDGAGTVLGAVMVFHDVTERRRAQMALRRSESLLSDFFENAAVGLHWVGPDGKILRVNRAELELLGYSEEEYVGHAIAEFHVDASVIEDILARLRAGEALHSREARLRCKDGSIRDVLISSNVLWENGQFVHTRCFTRDITEQKRTQEALRRSEQRKAAILNAALDAIVTLDGEGKIVDFNPAAERTFGHRHEEAIGKPLVELLVAPELRARHSKEMTRFLSCGEGPLLGKRVEMAALHADGHEFPMELSLSPVPDVEPRLFTAILRDITESKEAYAVQERLAAIVESSDDGIIGKTLQGIVTSWNRAAERIFGYRADEMIGKPITTLIPHDRLSEEDFILKRLGEGQRVENYESVRVTKDGRLIDVSLTSSPIRDAAGRVIGASKIVRDISERKRTDEALRQAAVEREYLLESERSARATAERMSEMKDEFLAMLSHELRTPLSAIVGWAQALRRGIKGEADLRKGLEAIERNARVQAQLIEDLLDMSRITSGKLRLDIQLVQPINVIEAAIETIRPAAEAKGILIDKLLDPAAGPVYGDPGRLQQVLWNLLSNSVKFTPKGGTVKVVLERVGSHVEISVADTGIGIQPQFLEHVFERFRQADASTTRRHGGLGLGLSIVKRLVEMHGGTVRADSEGEGRGAVFTVDLPTAPMRSTAIETRPHPTSAQTVLADFEAMDLSGIKVLVVDDEPDARELIARVLADCGAEVFSANTANDALLLAEEQRPDVLISDIGMPDVDGFDLLRRVRALGSARGGRIPAIALTAFARSQDRTRALQAGFLVHVAKPVEASELIATVATVAGRTGKCS